MENSYLDFEKDFYPFWSFLGLEEDCTREQVLQVVKTLTVEEKKNPFIRFAWKALSDPYYHEMFKTYRSIKKLYDAGFFLDSYWEENSFLFDVNFLTTPYQKIIDKLKEEKENDKPFIVLLSTGGYSPIHKRHVEIMELAKKELEKGGYCVIGGYLSPSHDKYVSGKRNGEAEMNIEKRVYLIEQAIKDSDWLYADKWEAYYNAHSINFTDVIVRLERYLNTHIKTKNGIQVAYVFGADNAEFVRTFHKNGMAVCVNRLGYNEKIVHLKKEYKENKNIFFVEKNEKEKTSSSLVRNGNMHLLTSDVKTFFEKIENDAFATTKKDIYAIRNDLNQAFFGTKLPVKEKDKEDLLNRFFHILSQTFQQNITLKEIGLDDQYKKAKKILETRYSHLSTLSLDMYIRGDVNFDISRLFDLASSQLKPKCLINRPKTKNLDEQLKNIKKGKYLLIEDDVATGTTLKKLCEMLPEDVFIEEKLILSDLGEETKNELFYDIVDMRDFVLGINGGGLVVNLPNEKTIRVPYVLPYVSPISRAKIPFGKEKEFSIQIWEMNKVFYENLEKKVKLCDLDECFQKLMTYVGFKPTDNVIDIISWHIEKLKRTVG